MVSALLALVCAGLMLPGVMLSQSISWTGGGDGTSWDQPANWSENRVPGENDDVSITLNSTYTIVQPNTNITINSLIFGAEEGVQTLEKTTNNFTINDESSIEENGIMLMSAGYLTGDGTLTNNGTIISAAASWSGINGFSLINNGTIEHQSGIFYLAAGAILQNIGLYDIQGDNNVQQSGSGTTFINSGRFLKSQAADGFSSITVPFDNRPESVIESAAGEIRFQTTSIHHNLSLVADQADATIRFAGGVHTFRGTISGAPTGLIILNTPSEAHSDGAIFDFGGTGLTWATSYMQGGGTFSNEGLIRLNAAGWTGVNGSTFINNGNIEHQSGIFYLAAGAILQNIGLYDIHGDNDVQQSGSGTTFINSGRFLKSQAADGFTSITVPFDSRPESVIESATGEIRFQTTSTHHNLTLVAEQADATIRFAGGVHTFRGTISGAPTGLIILNTPSEAHSDGATFDFGGTGLTWVSSYMQGGGLFSNDGLIRLNAAGWTGVNGSTFINNGTIEHQSGIFYLAAGAILQNMGLYDIQGDNNVQQSGSGTTFINSGSFLKSQAADGFTSITVPFETQPESRVESVAGEIRFQGTSSYHNTLFSASTENAIIRFSNAEHTFRGEITGEPVGQIIVNTNIRAHAEDGATWNVGGTGLTWASSYLLEGGVLTNTGLVNLDANGWNGINRARMINEGDIIQKNGIFYIALAAEFENNGLFNSVGGTGIQQSGTQGSFLNNDRLIIATESESFLISVNLENSSSSTLHVQSSNVSLTGGGSHNSPDFQVSEGASLNFNSGTHLFNGSITTEPAGDFVIRSNFGIDSGTSQFNITGTGLRWENGSLISGTFINNGLVEISDGGTAGLDGGNFINNSRVTLNGRNFRIMSGSDFLNNSTFEATSDFSFISSSSEPGRFLNAGLFHKSGGESVSQVRADMINQPNGELRLSTGEVRFISDFLNAENALISGMGNLDLAQTEPSLKGITSPGEPKGALTYIGDFQPNDTTSVLEILLYPTDDEQPEAANTMLFVNETEYRVGFRRIGGNAILAGELSVRNDPGFIPEPGTEFEIIRAERGITGGFSSYNGLVDLANSRSYYPQVRDTSLVLLTSDEIPTLSGTIDAEPASIQAGEEQMITFTGTGFPPDVSVELNCIECNEPDLFSTISGRVGTISPDTAEVWFDVSDPLISGTYEAVMSDPRGGEARTEITINQAPLALSVHVLKESTEGNDNTGLFVIRANRMSQETMQVPYMLTGSAQQYIHYTTDLLGGTILFPAGSDSVVVSILPLQTEEPETLTVGLQIQQTNQVNTLFKAFNPTFASMVIETDSGEIDDLIVLNYTPNRGGNVGFVTVTVTGLGFSESSTLQLTGGNGSGIIANSIEVNETGSKLTGQFNLIGQSVGVRDLVINNGAGQERTLSGAFLIEKGIYPDIFVQVLAPERVPRIRNRSYTVMMQNQGNVDVTGFSVVAGFPTDTEWELKNGEVQLSNGSTRPWHEVVPARQDGDRLVIELPAITLSAGASHKFEITASIPQAINMQLIGGWIYR